MNQWNDLGVVEAREISWEQISLWNRRQHISLKKYGSRNQASVWPGEVQWDVVGG